LKSCLADAFAVAAKDHWHNDCYCPDAVGAKGDNGLSPHEGRPALRRKEHNKMLYWAAVFFILALIASLFGFGGIAAGAAQIAQILFILFIAVFLISLVMAILRREP
jgi:uncharacterized membrane protein YtjA (UPF0391 family)